MHSARAGLGEQRHIHRYPLGATDWVVDSSAGNGSIDRVKLTILDVYPGTKHQDTAISEFYISGDKR
ncbi:MAG TPA: hypothetical protein VK993_04045 [Chthoniobacterales bacterium]|nr:hypothetical protein [Chthoniobacterales bacterium]